MNTPTRPLLDDLRRLIAEARTEAAVAVNQALTLLYWRVGQRIHADVLGGERAAYGDEAIPVLARHLMEDYGTGFSEKSLRHMVPFAEVFPDEASVVTLSRHLSWWHFQAKGRPTPSWP